MGEAVRYLAIICEEQYPLDVEIEPADGEYAPKTPGQQIRHRGPVLALLVAHGGEHVLGLVQHQIDGGLLSRDELSVHLDGIRERVRLGAGGEHGLSVHLDAALRDQTLGLPARGEARLGDDFLESDGGHRRFCSPVLLFWKYRP